MLLPGFLLSRFLYANLIPHCIPWFFRIFQLIFSFCCCYFMVM